MLIDEAQHLSKMGSGRRLSDQLDVLKSLANRTRTVHVLIGTYELLAFRNLSAQLSRRSVDIHFPRYRTDNADDLKAFQTILRSLEQQLPLSETPNLLDDWEYMYERSIGCVGILKDWLMRTLISVLRRDVGVLTHKDLQAHALSVAQCDKMLSEALEGERSLEESTTGRNRLRARLGLTSQEHTEVAPSVGHGSVAAAVSAQRQNRRRPGQRSPVRDAVGTSGTLYATAATL